MKTRLTLLAALCFAIFVTLFVANTWAASNEKVLHSFNFNSFNSSGRDGSFPLAGLIFDSAGNLYGTTSFGGIYGGGTVFELTPTADGGWTEKVLHNFSNNGSDGFWPTGGLAFDAAGNLYGTTYLGGSYYCYGGYKCGTVFELTRTTGGDWTEKVLHSFNGTDGSYVQAGLIIDSAGNLYGTTYGGGTYGDGTVFELTPNSHVADRGWTEKVLHNFNNDGTDGVYPYAGLIIDASGNLYGTTSYGGTYDCYDDDGYHCGTVFELTPMAGGVWKEKVLHSFGNGTDAAYPYGGLAFDAAGNLYGTTYGGGTYSDGTVFELTPNSHVADGGWTEEVLHSFGTGTDAAYPHGGLIIDAAGNLYGMTYRGGFYGYGTVFELTPRAGGDWTEEVLHSFNNNGTDGVDPYAGLMFDSAGNLYGTTYGGGAYSHGTVFEIVDDHARGNTP
jgi:uncharacterized repeat protein (TIGR03803 family)